MEGSFFQMSTAYCKDLQSTNLQNTLLLQQEISTFLGTPIVSITTITIFGKDCAKFSQSKIFFEEGG